MPNHVTNELTAPKHVIDFLKTEESEVDFNTVVPMPAVILRGDESSTVTDWARFAVGDVTINDLRVATPDPVAAFKQGDYGAASKRLEQGNRIRLLTEGPFPRDFSDSDFENFIQCIRALREVGCASWYDWSVEHWGTKWNAYDIRRLSDTVIKFDTAWSMPAKWFQALVERFSDDEITIRWADEDFGNNVGAITVKGETVSGGPLENGSAEAEELALALKHDGVLPEYMIRNESGRIAYVED